MCKQSLSLALSLVCSPSFAYALLAAGSQNRALSTHQSPASWSSGNLGGDDDGTSGPSCFRFTLPSACFGRPHFRNCPEAVPSRGLAPFGKIREDLGQCVGRRRAARGQGKIDSSPPARFGVSPHARPHTHVAPLRHPRADGQRTNTNAICQPSFISLSSFLRSHSAGRAGALRCSLDGFNGFLHTLEFFRASSPFSRISMHTYTRNTPNTLSK